MSDDPVDSLRRVWRRHEVARALAYRARAMGQLLQEETPDLAEKLLALTTKLQNRTIRLARSSDCTTYINLTPLGDWNAQDEVMTLAEGREQRTAHLLIEKGDELWRRLSQEGEEVPVWEMDQWIRAIEEQLDLLG